MAPMSDEDRLLVNRDRLRSLEASHYTLSLGDTEDIKVAQRLRALKEQIQTLQKQLKP